MPCGKQQMRPFYKQYVIFASCQDTLLEGAPANQVASSGPIMNDNFAGLEWVTV